MYVIHCLIFFSFSEIIISCTQLVPELLEFFWNLVILCLEFTQTGTGCSFSFKYIVELKTLSKN